ncbi:hypothetical protein FJM67_15810 [Maribrevibacterium harenarium]|uniref:Peptidase M50 domain-containing protein n=1 Tax=Maribrevibacterium harenarium TaxID=2589817 RepID=A0A501WEY5_9GAMM|nr:site-2 protease family protein [Maribrevibacterium harenarium]TPE46624.1 hypothetical protein FJM67_15810 [Maribrevibacterium harenarium]
MSSTFSEGWYQIAQLRVALIPTTKIHKQLYRGTVWYVLQDACSGKFFRVPEVVYHFISRLSVTKTVEEVWQSFIDDYPENAPGQEEVIQVLSQLHHSNLLFYRSESDHGAILERRQKQHRQEHLTKLMAFMYLRIPIWNPEALLTTFNRLLSPLFSKLAFVIWLIVIGFGVDTVLSNWSSVRQQGQGFLSPDNLILLYLSLFGLKFIHEMGHAIAIKRFGGQVHTLGLMFIVLTPLPYVDATQTWALRNRWQRAIVGSAGMYFELFIAAIAAMVWARTAPGVVNSLAYNLMIIGSVSSLLFNGNPLLKFDAYYILSDATDLPNLYKKANDQWLYYFNRWLFGTKKAQSPSDTAYERTWYTLYGVGSLTYRLAVVLVITLYAADLWIGLGIAMFMVSFSMWVLIPLWKLLRFLSSNQEIRKNRRRAWFSTLMLFSLIIGGVAFVPMPYHIKAPGVIQSNNSSTLFTRSGGYLITANTDSGIPVKKGDVLARFRNPDLSHQYDLVQQQIVELDWRLRQSLDSDQAGRFALEQQRLALTDQLEELTVRLNQLAVVAPFDGIWVPRQLKSRSGSFFNQADEIGTLYDFSQLRFSAVVTQEQASNLFNNQFSQEGELRLLGQTETTLVVDQLRLNPFRQTILPANSLGWAAGGPVMAQRDRNGNMVTQEPFFEVLVPLSQANINSTTAIQSPVAMEGMMGWLLIELAWQPLYWQARQALLQIFQRRYQI